MSQPPTEDPSPGSQQWQQPSFGAGDNAEIPVVSGSVVVPGEPVPPPGALELAARTVSGLLWPVLIILALAGFGNFWLNILIAIVGTTVLNRIASELKRRRRAQVRPIGPR